MTVITTRIVVAANGTASLAAVIPEGEYLVDVQVPDDRIPLIPHSEWTFPQLDVGPWPQGTTFSREEIYGDDDR